MIRALLALRDRGRTLNVPTCFAGISLLRVLALILLATVLVDIGCNSGGGGSSPAIEDPDPDPDPTPVALEVLETSPADEATGVARMTQIEVVFSTALDVSTVEAASFAVSGSTSGTIQGAYSLADGDATVFFMPTAPYAYEETVLVKLGEALRSTEGEQLAAEFSFSFTIE